MRRGYCILVLLAAMTVVSLVGCGNPIKRPPNNVFPGSEEYAKRVGTFKISPSQAYDIALEQAETDNKLQFLSKKPTVVTKQWYVFSMPRGSGASLQGYHVHGNTGEVRFSNQKTVVSPSR